MTDPLHCGSIRERVDNCSDLETRGECQPNDTGYWMNVNGKTHLCEWNPSRNQCVYGPSCECPAAPFSLNLFGFESGSPTSCEDLNSEQCDYFETLLNIERDAVRFGCKETFLLLQDNDEMWLKSQRAYYEHVQSSNRYRAWPQVQVSDVALADDHAQVVLSRDMSHRAVTCFFRRRCADWVRAFPPPPQSGL